MVVVAVVLPVTIRMICEVMGFFLFSFYFFDEFPQEAYVEVFVLHGNGLSSLLV